MLSPLGINSRPCRVFVSCHCGIRGHSPTSLFVCPFPFIIVYLCSPYVVTRLKIARLCQSDTCFFFRHPLSPLPPFFVPWCSQADPEAEKKEEADPANQAEVLHTKTHFFSSSCLYLNICLFKFCSLCQTANEEEEKEDDGMWEETFKTFLDSKPNGIFFR